MVFLCMFSRDDCAAKVCTFCSSLFFPRAAKAPFTHTQRILLIMVVRGGQTTTTTTTRKRANNRRSSVTPTPPPNLMAPDSEEDEEEEDDDTTTGKTTRRNTTSNFKIHRRGGGRHDGGSISTAVVLTLVCAFVSVGVFMQARTVAKIVKGVRTTTTTTELDPSIQKEVQKMKEKMELQRKEMDALKKVLNEEKPWEFAMQKTIDAWYEGSSGKNSKGSWFGVGKRKHSSSSSLPPWTAKDEEIEKATAQLRADLEDVKLKLARRGVSTQTSMQRMTHMLADKTGLVDYASVHGGGRVLRHSTLSPLVARESGPITAMLMYFRGKAAPHPKSNEWLLKQTLEPPGDCLALRGTKGYVDVHLKEKITVSGFTLEHVNPLIAYDRSSAPKEVKLGAWGMFPKVTTRSSTSDDSNDNTKNDDNDYDVKKMSWRYEEFGNFTFDPTVADGVTTFTFSEDKIVGTTDRVRFSVYSNHGNTKWTCVYRLRVHGSKNK